MGAIAMSETPGEGANVHLEGVLVNGPSVQSSRMMRALALVTNTASPASRGNRVWRGDPGYGVNRFPNEVPAPQGGPVAGAIAPLSNPVSPRYDPNPTAYPSTGTSGDFGSVGMLDLGKLGKLGWGN